MNQKSQKSTLSASILGTAQQSTSRQDAPPPHRSSPAVKAFRPRMKALQDAGEVIVSGASVVEIGLGFT